MGHSSHLPKASCPPETAHSVGVLGQLSDSGDHSGRNRRLGLTQDMDTHPRVGAEFPEPGGAGVQWRKCGGPQLPCLCPLGWGSVVCDSQFTVASGDWAPPGGRGAGRQPQSGQRHGGPARGGWGPPPRVVGSGRALSQHRYQACSPSLSPSPVGPGGSPALRAPAKEPGPSPPRLASRTIPPPPAARPGPARCAVTTGRSLWCWWSSAPSAWSSLYSACSITAGSAGCPSSSTW